MGVPGAATSAPGSAFVYRLVNGTWSLDRRLVDLAQTDCNQLGAAVAIAGDSLLVGAPGAIDALTGSVLVFDSRNSIIDCNGNAIDDQCELAAGFAADCNGNGSPDDCDIAGGNRGETPRVPATITRRALFTRLQASQHQ